MSWTCRNDIASDMQLVWPLKIAYFDAIVQPIANKDKAIPHLIGPDKIAPDKPLTKRNRNIDPRLTFIWVWHRGSFTRPDSVTLISQTKNIKHTAHKYSIDPRAKPTCYKWPIVRDKTCSGK